MSNKTRQANPVSQFPDPGKEDNSSVLPVPGLAVPYTEQPALYGESPGYDPYDNRSGLGCTAVHRQ